jgi:hypothetical protein
MDIIEEHHHHNYDPRVGNALESVGAAVRRGIHSLFRVVKIILITLVVAYAIIIGWGLAHDLQPAVWRYNSLQHKIYDCDVLATPDHCDALQTQLNGMKRPGALFTPPWKY